MYIPHYVIMWQMAEAPVPKDGAFFVILRMKIFCYYEFSPGSTNWSSLSAVASIYLHHGREQMTSMNCSGLKSWTSKAWSQQSLIHIVWVLPKHVDNSIQYRAPFISKWLDYRLFTHLVPMVLPGPNIESIPWTKSLIFKLLRDTTPSRLHSPPAGLEPYAHGAFITAFDSTGLNFGQMWWFLNATLGAVEFTTGGLNDNDYMII